MPIEESADAPDSPHQREQDDETQSFGDVFMKAVTALGNGIRSTIVEANNCVRGCAYPAKQGFIKIYDSITSNMGAKRTVNLRSISAAPRFGNFSEMSD